MRNMTVACTLPEHLGGEIGEEAEAVAEWHYDDVTAVKIEKAIGSFSALPFYVLLNLESRSEQSRD